MTSAKRKILIAGMGTSPAVLTNVVWALAHGGKPVVPDEIVVLITKNGKTLLKKELFDDGVWADMLKSLARDSDLNNSRLKGSENERHCRQHGSVQARDREEDGSRLREERVGRRRGNDAAGNDDATHREMTRRTSG